MLFANLGNSIMIRKLKIKEEIEMYKLPQFLFFDCLAFLLGKTLQVVSCGPLVDYETKSKIGTKVGVVITSDETEYKVRDGETVSNVFEKFNVKVVGKELTLTPGTVVNLVNPRGVVYGEYRNNLSVTADDIQPVQSKKE